MIAYKLALLPYAQIHHVYHVSQLKKKIGPTICSHPLLDCLNEEGELELKPSALLDYCYSTKKELEILVKWRNLLDFENLWEAFTSFK